MSDQPHHPHGCACDCHRRRANVALRHAIVDRGRKARDLARAAGLSGVTFSGIVTGRLASTANTRSRIARALGRPEATCSRVRRRGGVMSDDTAAPPAPPSQTAPTD